MHDRTQRSYARKNRGSIKNCRDVQVCEHVARNKHHSEDTKELCRQNTLANLDVCIAGFRRYNESRKIKVGMIDESNEIIKKFDSLSDACNYLGVKDKSNTAHIKRYADKINKNGKRAKFLGYSWTLL